MRFVPFTTGSGASARTFSAAEQETAWEAFIQQDSYLSTHRGQYAERNAVFLPQVVRADVSISQDVFRAVNGKRNTLQIRLDILNVGNLLNNQWGVGSRLTTNQPLTNGAANAAGELTYRLRNIGTNNLLSSTYAKNSSIFDVYRMQLGLRYTFN